MNNIYIEGPERRELAAASGLTVAQVEIWFKNRRARTRRQSKEGTGEEEQEEGEMVQGEGGADPNELVQWAEVVMDGDQVEEVAGEGEGHGQEEEGEGEEKGAGDAATSNYDVWSC